MVPQQDGPVRKIAVVDENFNFGLAVGSNRRQNKQVYKALINAHQVEYVPE